jgi:hypothetical protein
VFAPLYPPSPLVLSMARLTLVPSVKRKNPGTAQEELVRFRTLTSNDESAKLISPVTKVVCS